MLFYFSKDRYFRMEYRSFLINEFFKDTIKFISMLKFGSITPSILEDVIETQYKVILSIL